MDESRDKPVWLVQPKTRLRARSLRRDQTDAERKLWAALRAHRLQGTSFRRQSPVGPFIADFVCHDARLIVELDGGQHYEAAHELKDARRDAFLVSRGFRVLRFSNHEVMTNLQGVLETITANIEDAPSLTLPRQRGREKATASGKAPASNKAPTNKKQVMKFTLSWLKEHLDTIEPLEAIADKLTMIGLEVEQIDDKAKALQAFTIAYVVEAKQHPNADRLRVCMVDTGAGDPVQVVCGAPNARTGMKGVFSAPGTFIPGKNITLGIGTIRGVESRGMLCSAAELAALRRS